MRITVHIPDRLGARLKQDAETEGLSVSAVAARALEWYLKQKRRREAGNRLLEFIGKGVVANGAHRELERGRRDDRP